MKTAQEIFNALIEKRGITDVEAFVNPKYEDCHDPFLLPDMKPAFERLKFAREHDELVAIYGDYDIDGLTATTVLQDAFSNFEIKTTAFIPDRYQDGYGLSKRGVDQLHKEGAKLIVTVDCGSLSFKEIDYANKLGIDVIVTDHHTVGDKLPKAVAVINAKRKDSKYPFNDLAGVGVAFKLVQALQHGPKKGEGIPGLDEGQEKWLLDLVALGTVCDVVSLVDENRIFVKFGLQVMKRTRREGLRALAAVSETSLADVDTTTFGFRFGPRLNAAGRLESAQASLNLLSAQKGEGALVMAQNLNQLNTQRRSQQKEITTEATAQADEYANDPVLVLSSPDWSHGIVGIVAAKLVEELQKPTFILQEKDDHATGSARSFGDFSLAEAIAAVDEHIEKGGGHSMAAGVTVKNENIDDFRQAMIAHYKSLKLNDQADHLAARPDLEVESFAGFDTELLELLDRLQPYGMGNEEVVFRLKDAQLKDWRAVGQDQTHAKATIADLDGISHDAIGFGLAKKMAETGEKLSPVFVFEANTFSGRTKPQLRLIAI